MFCTLFEDDSLVPTMFYLTTKSFLSKHYENKHALNLDELEENRFDDVEKTMNVSMF